jgi:hypothetical protein
MTAARNPMQPLYDKLAEVGFKKKLVQQLLPDWWDDKIASTPSGYQSAAMRLAKLFSLRYSSLTDNGAAEFALAGRCFKRQVNIDIGSLDQASALASLAARLTIRSLEGDFVPPPPSGASIRESILHRGLRWVDFKALVDYCWGIGIPVIHCPNLPAPKMQGLAHELEDRPSIVLTSGRKYGYLVFDLAHELGHIALGHVRNTGWVLDEKINTAHVDSAAGQLDIEAEANKFAIELLTGNGNKSSFSHG